MNHKVKQKAHKIESVAARTGKQAKSETLTLIPLNWSTFASFNKTQNLLLPPLHVYLSSPLVSFLFSWRSKIKIHLLPLCWRVSMQRMQLSRSAIESVPRHKVNALCGYFSVRIMAKGRLDSSKLHPSTQSSLDFGERTRKQESRI